MAVPKGQTFIKHNMKPEHAMGCFLLRGMGSATLEVFKQKQNDQCEECCKDNAQMRCRFDPVKSAVSYNPEGALVTTLLRN